jgi:hypothetical protein
VIFLKVVLFFIFLSQYSSFASSKILTEFLRDTPLKTNLGRSLARVMTMGRDNHVVPHFDHHRAFMNQHWINRWQVSSPNQTKRQDGVFENKEPSLFYQNLVVRQDEPIIQLHQELSERFLHSPSRGRWEPKSDVNVHPVFRIAKKAEDEIPYVTESREKAFKTANECFLEGHAIEFSDIIVDFPIVVVSMYPGVDYTTNIIPRPVIKPWWIPQSNRHSGIQHWGIIEMHLRCLRFGGHILTLPLV